jgi:hypothetical protein
LEPRESRTDVRNLTLSCQLVTNRPSIASGARISQGGLVNAT